MDIKMHFYGTYYFLRLMGMKKYYSYLIASIDQGVDDETGVPVIIDGIKYIDGSSISGFHRSLPFHCSRIVSANADKISDLIESWGIEPEKHVYPIFHFPGGGEGETRELYLRTIPFYNNKLLNEIYNQITNGFKCDAYHLALLGIFSHVMQDSYAHWGFSGIASSINLRSDFNILKTQIRDKEFSKSYSFKILSSLAQVSGIINACIGHICVLLAPEYPSWVYESKINDAVIQTNNPDIYFRFFKDYLKIINNIKSMSPQMFEGEVDEQYVLNQINNYINNCGYDEHISIIYIRELAKNDNIEIPYYKLYWYLENVKINNNFLIVPDESENWIKIVHESSHIYRIITKYVYNNTVG